MAEIPEKKKQKGLCVSQTKAKETTNQSDRTFGFIN